MIALVTNIFAGAALVSVAAVHVPTIDVAKLCAGAGVFGEADRAVAACRRQETQARDRLRALWPQLRPDDRTTCLGGAELGVARSYADILGCVETSREVRRENALPPDTRRPP